MVYPLESGEVIELELCISSMWQPYIESATHSLILHINTYTKTHRTLCRTKHQTLVMDMKCFLTSMLLNYSHCKFLSINKV